ncbi:ECF transporter S component [Eubacterium sp. 1001713B170207_170306_E7]|uniref:ECF transporter S component n=1 Tax=Eubacterium sp. 1001713B170207_170306_E7 TaxID=2787097 RepID=UPI00189C1019
MNITTKKVCYTALLMAVTFIMISVVKIPIPNGYIHLGDAAVFLCGFILGPVYGTIAAALGAGAADYFAGFGAYIIPTMLAKGVMACLTGYFLRGNPGRRKEIGVMAVAGVIMTLIYYVSEILLYGSFVSPLVNIPFNALQALVGIVISMLLFRPLTPFRIES